MALLAINTATSKTAIALFSKDENYQLLSENSWLSSNDEAEKLMPKIQELIGKNKDFSEITEVLVISGPGSFTGLRVGVTVANTIKYLNSAKLYQLNTFEYCWNWFQNFLPQNNSNQSAQLIFAGSRGVYFSRSSDHIKAEKIENINLDELKEKLKNENISEIFGDISEDQKGLLAEISQITFHETENSFGEIIEQYLNNNKLIQKELVAPLYVKPPEITKSKKSILK